MYTKLKNWYVNRIVSECVMIGCDRCKRPFLIHIHQLEFEMGSPYTTCPICMNRINLVKGKNMLFVSYVDE